MCSPGPNANDSPICHSRWTEPGLRGADPETCAHRVIRQIGIAININPHDDGFFDSMPEGFTCEARCHHELGDYGIQKSYETSNTVRTFECEGGASDCMYVFFLQNIIYPVWHADFHRILGPQHVLFQTVAACDCDTTNVKLKLKPHVLYPRTNQIECRALALSAA
jgi:hypothetical protein